MSTATRASFKLQVASTALTFGECLVQKMRLGLHDDGRGKLALAGNSIGGRTRVLWCIIILALIDIEKHAKKKKTREWTVVGFDRGIRQRPHTLTHLYELSFNVPYVVRYHHGYYCYYYRYDLKSVRTRVKCAVVVAVRARATTSSSSSSSQLLVRSSRVTHSVARSSTNHLRLPVDFDPLDVFNANTIFS